MLSNCSVEKSTFDGVVFAFKHNIGRYVPDYTQNFHSVQLCFHDFFMVYLLLRFSPKQFKNSWNIWDLLKYPTICLILES